MNIYLLHTHFNEKYSSHIKNELFYITSDHTGIEGFGKSTSLCQIHYDDQLNVLFDDNIEKIPNCSDLILLVSDQKFAEKNTEGEFINEEYIKTKLKELIKQDDSIHLIFHDNHKYVEFIDYFQKTFSTQVKNSKGAKHFVESEKKNFKNFPFFKLVDLVNSETKIEYETAFQGIKSFLPSEKEVKENTDLNKKLSLLYKILGEPLLTENTFKGEEEELARPYFDCDISDSKEDEKTARLRHLRDVLLKDVI